MAHLTLQKQVPGHMLPASTPRSALPPCQKQVLFFIRRSAWHVPLLLVLKLRDPLPRSPQHILGADSPAAEGSSLWEVTRQTLGESPAHVPHIMDPNKSAPAPGDLVQAAAQPPALVPQLTQPLGSREALLRASDPTAPDLNRLSVKSDKFPSAGA